MSTDLQSTLDSVQEHARKLTAQLGEQGKINNVGDPDAATAAALVPNFSSGTRAIDPNTGEAIAQAEFTQATVALQEDTETTGRAASAPDPNAAAQVAQRERDAQGRFVGEPTTEAQPTTQTPEQAAGTQAAEAAAAQLAEEMDDYEFEDPDLAGIKIPLKYPKKYAGIIKRAVPRMADYHRIRNRWGDAASVLEPLLADGRFARVLPMIQRAMTDDTYGNFVLEAFQRAQQGLPLVPRETVQPQVQQPVQPTQAGDPGFVDPVLEMQLAPVLSRLQAFEQRFQTQEQQQEEARRMQQQTQAQQMQAATMAQAAHNDLANMYPSEYKFAMGPNDPAYQRASQYANEAGYIEAYGIRGGIVFAAQQLAALEAARLQATASPAAAALQQVDQRQIELARQQAAQSARAAGGGAAVQTATPAPRPKPPSTTDANGNIKPLMEHMAELAGYIQQTV